MARNVGMKARKFRLKCTSWDAGMLGQGSGRGVLGGWEFHICVEYTRDV